MGALLKLIPKVERRAAMLSLVVSIALLGLKFAAYLLTNSAAVFSDAMESIVNVAAAAFAVYSLSYAHRPADAEHPYGHGKIEFFSAGFEGGMILLAALVMVAKAVNDLFHGLALKEQHFHAALTLLGIAFVANGWLGFHLIRTGRKQNSLALEADGRHLLTDAVTSAAAIAAVTAVAMTRLPIIDPLAAIVVAGYIAWTGIGLVGRSAAGLMDRQDAEDERLLTGILNSHLANTPGAKHPLICSYHKLRHRHSGRYHWVDFHIMVPSWWNIDEGHRVASQIEYEIEQAIVEGNATAHVEPCPNAECRRCAHERPGGRTVASAPFSGGE